jgi:hypothetical protein
MRIFWKPSGADISCLETVQNCVVWRRVVLVHGDIFYDAMKPGN